LFQKVDTNLACLWLSEHEFQAESTNAESFC